MRLMAPPCAWQGNPWLPDLRRTEDLHDGVDQTTLEPRQDSGPRVVVAAEAGALVVFRLELRIVHRGEAVAERLAQATIRGEQPSRRIAWVRCSRRR